MSSVKDFLSNLEKINSSNTISINIPSQNKDVDFKLISVNQQRKLMSTAFDGIDSVVKRSITLNNIVVENSLEDIDYLTIDRNTILLELRKKIRGSKYKANKKEYDLNDLSPIYIDDLEVEKQISGDSITINLHVPTLSVDTLINKKIQDELLKSDGSKDTGKNIEMVLSYEICKYIVDITIGEESICFADISVYERNKIVNNLPLSLNNKVIDYIGEVKDISDKALTLPDNVIVEIGSSFLSTD